MSRAAIEQLLYTMDEAFQGNDEHSLLANLPNLPDEDLRWVPPDGSRSAFDILVHVGDCKFVYQNSAFGDGAMRWDRPGSIPGIDTAASKDEIVSWLRRGHDALRDSVAALQDDGELLAMRRANWGAEYETRWLMNVMVQHDLYHAGEVNHIRALRQHSDRWAFEEG